MSAILPDYIFIAALGTRRRFSVVPGFSVSVQGAATVFQFAPRCWRRFLRSTVSGRTALGAVNSRGACFFSRCMICARMAVFTTVSSAKVESHRIGKRSYRVHYKEHLKQSVG